MDADDVNVLAAYGEALYRSRSVVTVNKLQLSIEAIEAGFLAQAHQTPVYVDRIAGIDRSMSRGHDDDVHVDDKLREATLAGKTYIAYVRTHFRPASRELDDEKLVFNNPLDQDRVAQFLLQRLVDQSIEGRLGVYKNLRRHEPDLPSGTTIEEDFTLKAVVVGGSVGLPPTVQTRIDRSNKMHELEQVAGRSPEKLQQLDADELLDSYDFLVDEVSRLDRAKRHMAWNEATAPTCFQSDRDIRDDEYETYKALKPLEEWEKHVRRRLPPGEVFTPVSASNPGESSNTFAEDEAFRRAKNPPEPRIGAAAYAPRPVMAPALGVVVGGVGFFATGSLVGSAIGGLPGIVVDLAVAGTAAVATKLGIEKVTHGKEKAIQAEKNYEQLKSLRQRQYDLGLERQEIASTISQERTVVNGIKSVVEIAYAQNFLGTDAAVAPAGHELITTVVGDAPVERELFKQWAHLVTRAGAAQRDNANSAELVVDEDFVPELMDYRAAARDFARRQILASQTPELESGVDVVKRSGRVNEISNQLGLL